jgi:putative sterol carrier protein
MERLSIRAFAAAAAFLATGAAYAAPVMMSADWAKAACAAWNGDAVLTQGLVKSEWVKNDKGRGYKLLHVYRTDCKDSKPVELRIATKGPQARCVYGGAVENAKLDDDADYLMHAWTSRWVEMGKGEYGPTKAMFLGRLEFEGPMLEAMGNMGPFENFLLLVGKVQSETGSCPK